ncbi:LacI family transcriptional regulator [Wenjunlia vitaminophila]|uniref:LacI family transcriptional regulator n=1 Tax=Wenjunlia vitaminophila TaxID=76728 RepID=A0A0T6LVT4_WENVI|nr:LacI family DNA-binding transcriptional regulator [Wenjunlia vitaminophila]KRV50263.1 LacI family transcriptional regulator [Wenjunlia vitaminophila]
MPSTHRDVAPGPRPTSRDVARAAGVSQATVSLVLGGKWQGRVSPRTAAAVREAATDLGYRPNLAARDLRLGSTRTALLVVPALTSEFFGNVYAGAVAVAAEHGFGLVLYPSPQGVGTARNPFESTRGALDGVIASSMAADALREIRGSFPGGQALPLVMLDSAPPTAPGDPGHREPDAPAPAARDTTATVNHDLADGMRQVVGHLTGLGHRRITHLGAAIDSWTFRVRSRTFRESMATVPDAVPGSEPADLSVGGGQTAARRALTGPGPRPTALVCDDDTIAAGACKAVRRLGLSVPGDVSVTGFDDLSLATALDPELTTVRLPAQQLGAHGMRALLDLLAGSFTERPPLPVTLAVRDSTAPAPRR